jgi:hypothetical protein
MAGLLKLRDISMKIIKLYSQAIGEPSLWEEAPGNAKRNQNLR